MKGTRLGVVAALAFVVASCAYTGNSADGGAGKPSPTVNPGWKTVVEKREPVYLIADDRSECQTSADNFKKAQVGKRKFCLWTRTKASGAAY
jgi:hypothetical protein